MSSTRIPAHVPPAPNASEAPAAGTSSPPSGPPNLAHRAPGAPNAPPAGAGHPSHVPAGSPSLQGRSPSTQSRSSSGSSRASSVRGRPPGPAPAYASQLTLEEVPPYSAPASPPLSVDHLDHPAHPDATAAAATQARTQPRPGTQRPQAPGLGTRLAGRAAQEVAARSARKGPLLGQRVPLTEAGVRALQESPRIDRRAGMMAGMKAGAKLGLVTGVLSAAAAGPFGFVIFPFTGIAGAFGGAVVGALFGLLVGKITPPRVEDIRKHGFSATGIVSYKQSGQVLDMLADANVLQRGAHGQGSGLSLRPGWSEQEAITALQDSPLGLNAKQVADILTYLKLTDALVAKPVANDEKKTGSTKLLDEKPALPDAALEDDKRFTASEKGKGRAEEGDVAVSPTRVES